MKRPRSYTRARRMKKRVTYKTKRNLRLYGRKRLSNTNRLLIPRAKIGIPGMNVIRMSFTRGQMVGDGSATAMNMVFRLRGAADPGFSSGTDSPIGFNTWLGAGLYQYYRVARVSYSVSIEPIDQTATTTRSPNVLALLYRSDTSASPDATQMGSNYLIDRIRAQPIRGQAAKLWPQVLIQRSASGMYAGNINNPRMKLDRAGRVWLGGKKGENMKRKDRSQPYGNPGSGSRMEEQQFATFASLPLNETFLGITACSSPVVLTGATTESILPLPCMWVTVNIWYTVECFQYSSNVIT